MKSNHTNLRIPGPTPVTPEILKEMSRFMINHRGDEFRQLIESVTERLKTIYETKQDLNQKKYQIFFHHQLLYVFHQGEDLLVL